MTPLMTQRRRPAQQKKRTDSLFQAFQKLHTLLGEDNHKELREAMVASTRSILDLRSHVSSMSKAGVEKWAEQDMQKVVLDIIHMRSLRQRSLEGTVDQSVVVKDPRGSLKALRAVEEEVAKETDKILEQAAAVMKQRIADSMDKATKESVKLFGCEAERVKSGCGLWAIKAAAKAPLIDILKLAQKTILANDYAERMNAFIKKIREDRAHLGVGQCRVSYILGVARVSLGPVFFFREGTCLCLAKKQKIKTHPFVSTPPPNPNLKTCNSTNADYNGAMRCRSWTPSSQWARPLTSRAWCQAQLRCLHLRLLCISRWSLQVC